MEMEVEGERVIKYSVFHNAYSRIPRSSFTLKLGST